MSEWQPIETAPKDGRDILLFGSGMIVASWDDEATDAWAWLTADGPAYHAQWPTHWMPLPEPPKETD